jgi:5-methylcytosine-specific restriction endonuclease McrA
MMQGGLLMNTENEYRPWIEYNHIWKTESAYLSWLRGGIRRSLWSKNPIKLEFEKDVAVQIPNYNPKSMKRFPTIAGGQCEICKGLFKKTDMEVDHKTGEFALRSISDIQTFVQGIVLVHKKDLAHLCKPCHGVKTHMERYEFPTFEEAKADKKAIEWDKKKAKQVIDFLTKSGIMPARKKEDRRNQLFEHFKKEYQNESK